MAVVDGDSNKNTLNGSNDDDVINGYGGNDKLNGMNGDDQLTGGTGNDTLVGAAGSDTYYFSLGDGQDTIYDYDSKAGDGSADATDVILFGTGITAEDLTIRREVDGDMAISIADSTDTVTVIHHFGGATIERIDFADGGSLTSAQISVLAAIGSAENDYLTGTTGKDTLDGKGGDDIILSLKGDDDLTGGTGNDDLSGGNGADTYRFNLGDGKDTIYDLAAMPVSQSETDTIVFGSGISASDVIVRATMHHDLVLSIANSSDKITISEGMYGIATRIEQVKFDDGTKWNAATLYNLQMGGTEAVDYIYGTSRANVISALGGKDYIWAGNGADILMGGSDGDRLYGDRGTDTASYADALAGVTASLSHPSGNTGIAAGDIYSSIENLTGSGFKDTLTGSSGVNVIDGGLGNDTMTGSDGRDTFVFGAGYGKDTISDFVATQKKNDLVDLSNAVGINSFGDLMKNHLKDTGSDVLITAADGATLRIQHVEPGALAAFDFLF
jgi:Ca2+-binding RTX toxin-like protein